ncbi:hypothetical protein N658DRAFT_496947 [Parathielavia hyrcaniae]|uniref:Required for respiratory growth protein 7, mitochondrial n=1 Tax=Parathielavia hyrcaniae TaxID=113614 RepID=A0AAN6PZJ5_9PEZI|nr:hypothetical protein N658DRAFT_496947 [Parathielavia hyrcaniae]
MRLALFIKRKPLFPQTLHPLSRRTFSAANPLSAASPLNPDQPEPPPPSPENATSPEHTHIAATPPNNPLIYPPSPSPHHTDLPSFLAHASRTNLDPASTVYVGTHFEYTAIQSLSRYGLVLRRVGGVSDGGIDLLGTWPSLPLPPPPSSSSSALSGQGSPLLRVLAQCKAVQRPRPHLIRELEGAFAAAPVGWRGRSGVVGLLVTEKPATKGIREALGRSQWPMGFVACSRDGRVEQLLWNRRAEEEGLEGVEVRLKYLEDAGRDLVLTRKGKALAPFVEGRQVEG